MRPTKIYIDLTKLDRNIKEIKKLIGPNVDYMAVVKANAYGHGAVEVSRQAIRSGAKWLAVAIPEEGVELRRAGIKAPILVLGPIDKCEGDLVVEYNLVQTVFSEEDIYLLNSLGKKHNKRISVHIKLDTGMGRIGIRKEEQLISFLELLKNLQYVDCQGIFTHFSSSDEGDKAFTCAQLKKFKDMINICENYGVNFKWKHAANSAAIIEYPSTYFNMVRGGIAMYGYYPSNKIDTNKINLYPILKWTTKVMYIKEVEGGTSISYGRTFISDRPMKIATIPVGYGDGYNRLLSNRGYVLIKGEKAPILGRICMDQTMVDVTHIKDVAKGDEVVLIGKQGDNILTADHIAGLCNTISYEILTGISNRVEKVYIKK